MYSTRGLIAAIVLSIMSLVFLWLTDIPLGIPGEWTWERISTSDAGLEIVLGAALAAIVGAVYILVAWLGSRRIANCSRAELAAWLLGIATIGFGWMLAVQEAPPSSWRLSKAAFVLFYPGSSGYFHKARYEMPDTDEFLRGYEDLMADGDVLHVGTHPPGLFLFYRAMINGLDHRPALAEFIAGTATESVAEALTIIDSNERRSGKELNATDRAVIWLATVLTQACCVLTVVPIFLLMRHSHSRDVSWKTAAFWPMLPALAIFIPKSDVLFVLPAALLVWIWLTAARNQSFFLGVLSGAIGWCGLFCSLAFLPIGLIALVASLLGTVKLTEGEGPGETPLGATLKQLATSLWKPLLGGVMALVGLTLVVSLVCEMNLLNVWIHNYHNHAAFYSQFTRTVWKWWLVNPVELGLAVGFPVVTLLVRSAISGLGDWRKAVQHPFLLSFVAVWTMLWLSGKNSGEAARLWNPLLPILLVVAADSLVSTPDSDETDDSSSERMWIILLTCQTVVCAATVMRVSGFHF